ncbi:PLP-dependent transferase [Ascobolus immersus RN42]|uniref:PLP-dependent transferase n=1 Tax=Ascobolus immersus RN42 TaxID=1160509 RepID=A0A3N4ICS0_ASCIM|nr:PLP-dependent transferase [Ascobolus immersus RN42]
MNCLKARLGKTKDEGPLSTLPKVMNGSQEKALVKELAKKGYNSRMEEIRKKEYPHMKGSIYLDHAGTTIYSRTLIDTYHSSLSTNLYGNPHSSNPSSALSSKAIAKTRKQVLAFFNADPEEYDIVFTSNATQALKLVADGFAGHQGGWDYRLHWDAHTSLVGVRALADGYEYSEDDEAVEEWLVKEKEGVPKSCCKPKELVERQSCCQPKVVVKKHSCYKPQVVETPSCCKPNVPMVEQDSCCSTKKEVLQNSPSASCCAEKAPGAEKAEETILSCCSSDTASTACSSKNDAPMHTEKAAFCEFVEPSSTDTAAPEVLYCFPEEQAARFDPPKTQRLGLFAWPAQSNFSGRRLPTSEWCRSLRKNKPFWYSLVDAASYAMTSPIDVSEMQPDFMAISFYKIFGYPDLGGLIIRKSSSRLLRSKKFFGGGTIAGLLISENWHDKKGNPAFAHQFLEDGTLPFHSILALSHALDSHNRILGPMKSISSHTNALVCWLYDTLSDLKHPAKPNAPLLQIYTPRPTDPTKQGAIIMFNVLSPLGELIPFTSIELDAIPYNLHLRAGRHCNLGGVQKYLDFSTAALKDAFKRGLRCNGFMEIRVEGRVIGAVRVSLGGMTTVKDCLGLVRFLRGVYALGDGCQRALEMAKTEEGRAPKGCCG